jgi:hypothetical protein
MHGISLTQSEQCVGVSRWKRDERLMSWTRQLPINTQDPAKHAEGMPGGIQEFLKRERGMAKAML